MSSPGSAYQLVITDPAQNDLRGIAAYSFAEWGEEQAVTYTEALYDTLSDIAGNPEAGQSRYGVPAVIKGRASGRHVVFYRVRGATIFILRILHERMDHGQHVP
jgi:toxin ParE1/3/4